MYPHAPVTILKKKSAYHFYRMEDVTAKRGLFEDDTKYSSKRRKAGSGMTLSLVLRDRREVFDTKFEKSES